MSKITEEILKEMRANVPLNMEKCEVIAEKHGLKARSIMASATRNKIEYTRKAKTSKSGKPVQSKADLVEVISGNLGLSLESLDGLDKATKTALESLASVEIPEDEG